jgi:hypothetical protein
MAWGLDMDKWRALPVTTRAEQTAHCLHKNIREAYMTEKASKDGTKKGSSVDDIMKGFF